MNFVDTKKMAEILQVNPETIRRMVRKGEIPFIKLGERDYRFNVDEVIATLKKDQ